MASIMLTLWSLINRDINYFLYICRYRILSRISLWCHTSSWISKTAALSCYCGLYNVNYRANKECWHSYNVTYHPVTKSYDEPMHVLWTQLTVMVSRLPPVSYSFPYTYTCGAVYFNEIYDDRRSETWWRTDKQSCCKNTYNVCKFIKP